MKSGDLLENLVIEHALQLRTLEEVVINHKHKHHIENNFCLTLLKNKYRNNKDKKRKIH